MRKNLLLRVWYLALLTCELHLGSFLLLLCEQNLLRIVCFSPKSFCFQFATNLILQIHEFGVFVNVVVHFVDTFDTFSSQRVLTKFGHLCAIFFCNNFSRTKTPYPNSYYDSRNQAGGNTSKAKIWSYISCLKLQYKVREDPCL